MWRPSVLSELVAKSQVGGLVRASVVGVWVCWCVGGWRWVESVSGREGEGWREGERGVVMVVVVQTVL